MREDLLLLHCVHDAKDHGVIHKLYRFGSCVISSMCYEAVHIRAPFELIQNSSIRQQGVIECAALGLPFMPGMLVRHASDCRM